MHFRSADGLIARRTVAEIQKRVIERDKRNPILELLRVRNDRDEIVAWKLELNRILHVFNVRSAALARLLLTVSFIG